LVKFLIEVEIMRKLFYNALFVMSLFFFLTPGLLQARVSGNNPEEFLPVASPEISLLPQVKKIY